MARKFRKKPPADIEAFLMATIDGPNAPQWVLDNISISETPNHVNFSYIGLEGETILLDTALPTWVILSEEGSVHPIPVNHFQSTFEEVL